MSISKQKALVEGSIKTERFTLASFQKGHQMAKANGCAATVVATREVGCLVITADREGAWNPMESTTRGSGATRRKGACTSTTTKWENLSKRRIIVSYELKESSLIIALMQSIRGLVPLNRALHH